MATLQNKVEQLGAKLLAENQSNLADNTYSRLDLQIESPRIRRQNDGSSSHPTNSTALTGKKIPPPIPPRARSVSSTGLPASPLHSHSASNDATSSPRLYRPFVAPVPYSNPSSPKTVQSATSSPSRLRSFHYIPDTSLRTNRSSDAQNKMQKSNLTIFSFPSQPSPTLVKRDIPFANGVDEKSEFDPYPPASPSVGIQSPPRQVLRQLSHPSQPPPSSQASQPRPAVKSSAYSSLTPYPTQYTDHQAHSLPSTQDPTRSKSRPNHISLTGPSPVPQQYSSFVSHFNFQASNDRSNSFQESSRQVSQNIQPQQQNLLLQNIKQATGNITYDRSNSFQEAAQPSQKITQSASRHLSLNIQSQQQNLPPQNIKPSSGNLPSDRSYSFQEASQASQNVSSSRQVSQKIQPQQQNLPPQNIKQTSGNIAYDRAYSFQEASQPSQKASASSSRQLSLNIQPQQPPNNLNIATQQQNIPSQNGKQQASNTGSDRSYQEASQSVQKSTAPSPRQLSLNLQPLNQFPTTSQTQHLPSQNIRQVTGSIGNQQGFQQHRSLLSQHQQPMQPQQQQFVLSGYPIPPQPAPEMLQSGIHHAHPVNTVQTSQEFSPQHSTHFSNPSVPQPAAENYSANQPLPAYQPSQIDASPMAHQPVKSPPFSFTSRPNVPPRSLSLERPNSLMSPSRKPRIENLQFGFSPHSPRSRQVNTASPSPLHQLPSQPYTPPAQRHNLVFREGRDSPSSLNLPFKSLAVQNDMSSSPESPGSFSLSGHSSFWGSSSNSPSPHAPHLAGATPGGFRRKMDIPLPMSPAQPKSPDANEIEMRYQEVMKRSGILNLDGQLVTTSINELECLGELGHGTCGHVMKMRHRKTGHVMAVKQMRRTGNRDENKRIIMDLDVVTKSHNCPYIVMCIGSFITKSDVWICMELMSTCLEKLLKRIKQPIPEKILGKVSVATINALHYLKEEHGVIHRDVKPSNILLDDRGHIKLCDFGISGRLVDSKAKTRTGCAAYMAPERIEPPDPTRPDYDIRADVWSFGISLVELATGAFPYPDCKNDFEVLARVLQEDPPRLPNHFSREFRDFVRHCLTKDYHKRPKYRALLQHAFIQMYTVKEVDVAQWYKQVLNEGQSVACSEPLTV